MRRNILTLNEIFHGYEPEVGDSKAMRIAKLLRYVERELPGSYVPRKYVAKVAFLSKKLPADGSEDLGKKLTSLISSAETILRRETGDYIERHRFLGIRINSSSQSKLDVTLENKRRRAEGVIRGIQEVQDNIKPEELSPEGRKRFSLYSKFGPLLEEFRKKVPLSLPETTKVDEDDKPKR